MFRKYNYIQLNQNFFNESEIKKLRMTKNGDKNLIIYLKLKLLSLKNNNKIYFEGFEENLFNQLELQIDENKDEIKTTVEFLLKNHLASYTDDFVLKIDNVTSKRNRSTKEYKLWRQKVFLKNKYTCQNCNKKGVYLEAHHIKDWSNHYDLRFDVSNGLTLCKECHKLIHKNGKTNGS